MLFKQHLAFGALVSTAITVGYSLIQKPPINQDDLALMLGACLIGSLAPDLDTNSKSTKIAALALTIFGIWSLVNREPYPGLILLVGFSFIKTFNHRTFTHIYTLPVVLIFVAIKFDVWWLIPFSVGLITHYFCDCVGPNKIFPWKLSSWIKPITII